MFAKFQISVLTAAACLALAIPAASAQVPCGSRDVIVTTLGEKYKESRQSLGLVGQDGKSVIELFVSEKGTWTMLMTSAKGATCVVAAGVGWQAAPQKVAGAGI
jgi:predicted methyltransferase